MNDPHSAAHLYVVGALPPDEANGFETHLSDCNDCQEEVAEMRDLTARLSMAVATEPPPALRAAILAQIAETEQQRADGSAATATRTRPITVLPARRSHARGSADDAEAGPPVRRRHSNKAVSLLAAAAVLTAVALGGWAVQSRQAAEDATARAEQLTQVLAADDVQTVSSRLTGGGSGTVVVSDNEGEALFVGSDLPSLPDGKVYALWAIDGEPVTAGTFAASDEASVVQLPTQTLESQLVAITVEPEGGSQQPTSDPVFSVEIPR